MFDTLRDIHHGSVQHWVHKMSPDESHHLCQWGLKIKICVVGKEKCIHWLCVCHCSPDGQLLGVRVIIRVFCALICKDIILLLWNVRSVILSNFVRHWNV